jgi:DICT domain-containing protein
VEDAPGGYRVLFELLDETVYTALERRELLAVSREIEDRAFRVGDGTLRVSFQTLSAFESQAALYHKLASATDLDIHIYGVDDWTPPRIDGITYHEFSAGPLERYWVLAFDGSSDGTHSCGLVGQEQSDGFDGFWTDDEKMVAEIMDRLERV